MNPVKTLRNLRASGTRPGTITPGAWNALLDFVQKNTLLPGNGYLIRNVPGGVSLNIKSNGKSVTQTVNHPFDVTVKSGSSSSDLIANVRPGSVNSLLPGNIFGDFHFDPSDVVKVKVRATTDGAKVTGAAMVVDTDEAASQVPAPFGLPVSVDVLVAVKVCGVPMRTLDFGSVVLTGTEAFRVSATAGPGELPYTGYYVWEVSVA